MSSGLFSALPWDSGFFGFPTARILPAALDEAGLRVALETMAKVDTQLAYWNVAPEDAVSNRAAATCGGFLADVKTTYAIEPPVSDSNRIRCTVAPVAGGVGTPALYALSEEAGKYSRFRVDPEFPPALFRALYVEWMRKSLSGEKADAVLSANEGGTPFGMVTVQAKDGLGAIGLVSVAPGHQGRGFGTSLIQSALRWFSDRGCRKVEVVTQEKNAEACRLYERNGFRLAEKVNVWHFRPKAFSQ
ncbi:MAG: GNAT family N-acetyltransferase [Fibrobacteria bacterium]